jgi:D-alanyl-D-alanine carboxypeptidase
MVTSRQCFAKWGDPNTRADEGKYMVLWDVPTALEIGVIPKRLYCNRAMIEPLTKAFNNIISRGLINQLKTWDGCFNIRKKRGATSQSLHAWGIAIDINAAWNGFGKKPTMSQELVKCFTDAGFDWGGTWSKPDGMHFQLAKI